MSMYTSTCSMPRNPPILCLERWGGTNGVNKTDGGSEWREAHTRPHHNHLHAPEARAQGITVLPHDSHAGIIESQAAHCLHVQAGVGFTSSFGHGARVLGLEMAGRWGLKHRALVSMALEGRGAHQQQVFIRRLPCPTSLTPPTTARAPRLATTQVCRKHNPHPHPHTHTYTITHNHPPHTHTPTSTPTPHKAFPAPHKPTTARASKSSASTGYRLAYTMALAALKPGRGVIWARAPATCHVSPTRAAFRSCGSQPGAMCQWHCCALLTLPPPSKGPSGDGPFSMPLLNALHWERGRGPHLHPTLGKIEETSSRPPHPTSLSLSLTLHH